MARIASDLIEQEETWDPQVFCSAILPILRLKSEQCVTAVSVTVVEGQRWNTDQEINANQENKAPAYRLSNVADMELRLTPDLCHSPLRRSSDGESRSCVEPGDLIVTKTAPIRAALATAGLFRHAVDANLCLVRGLDLPDAFWMALCLNQRTFGDYLVRKSGAAIVPRIRAEALTSVRFPTPPANIERLSRQVYECISQRLESQIEFVRFLTAVRGEIAALVPKPSHNLVDQEIPATWNCFLPSNVIDESLVPAHVAMNLYQHRLVHDAGWRLIREVTTQRRAGGARLADSNQSIRTLQLSDVADDLMVLGGQVRPVSGVRRVYADELKEDEVLLSALVSRPRIAFVAVRPKQPIFPTDHWHRLRFQETPGAWAAVLNDTEIRRQLARLAIGTQQQFAPSWTVQKLVLPILPLEIRKKWDSFLRRWQLRRVELETEWNQLMAESNRILQLTHRDCGVWTQPPTALRDAENGA